MGKVSVCDFCERGRFLEVRLKVRGRRFGFVPGMLGHATYDLLLCDECYVEMQDYIEQKVNQASQAKEKGTE